MSKLVRKIASAIGGVATGLSSIGSFSDNANAAVMQIETLPSVTNWRRDGLTPYTIEVKFDSTQFSTKIVNEVDWKLTIPSGVSSYLVPVSANLPDSINNPSQNSQDAFYNILCKPIGGISNVVKSFVSGVSSNNVRASNTSLTGFTNKDFAHGLLGLYTLTVSSTASLGNYTPTLSSVLAYDSAGVSYKLTSSNLTITNNSFNIVNVPAASLTNLVNATIVEGGSATLGATVNNNVASADDLYLNISATIGSGSANIGALSPSSTGRISSLGNKAYTFSASSDNIGVNTINFSTSGTGIDATNSLANSTAGLSLTVYNHSLPTFSLSGTTTNQTINVNALKGAQNVGDNFYIGNMAGFRTGVDYDGGNQTGSSLITIENPSDIVNLAAEASSRNYTVGVNASNYGTISRTGVFNFSDTEVGLLSGRAGQKDLTLVVNANVGNATADASNGLYNFGSGLVGYVAAGGNMAGLESRVFATENGAQVALGSVAKIDEGIKTSAGNITESWRARTTGEMSIKEGGTQSYPLLPAYAFNLLSDVVNIQGTGSDPYALEISYDQDKIEGSLNESQLAARGDIYLVRLNGNQWERAGNTGMFINGAFVPGQQLGTCWVNTANHTAGAYVDQSGYYAIVPDAATLALLGIGGAGIALRRRRQAGPGFKIPFSSKEIASDYRNNQD